ncbi:DUF6541 family protein [Leucobacter luti]|uniref:DUF6541 family protein n=1 Tax=Leucobacter luti TaxID=340320 RepID=UPI003D02B681
MTWLSAIPTFIVSAALLLFPGLIVGALIGLRRLWLVAVAPAISVTLVTAGSVILPMAGLSWNPLTALSFAALFGAVVVLLFRLLLRTKFISTPPESGRAWPTVVGWAIPTVILFSWAIAGIMSAENFSQTFDNVFHMNAIALIGDTGNASPFEVARLTTPDGDPGFYPDGWHALVQLAQQVTGASIPLAINSFNFAAIAVAWPTGIMLLSRQIAGSSRTATLAAGILAAAFPAFPLNLFHYGVLYPYFFSMLMVPAVLALSLNLLGITREPRLTTPASHSVLIAGVTAALLMAHPAAMMSALALVVPAATIAMLAGWTGLTPKRRLFRVLGYGLFVVIGLLLLYFLRQGDWWGARMKPVEAAWQTVSLSLWGIGLPLLTAVLMWIGLFFALRDRNRVGYSAAGIWLIAAALFFVAAGISNYWLRNPTLIWYGDAPRLAALYPIAVIPLAVIAVRRVAEWLSERPRFEARRWLPSAAALVLVALGTQALAGYPTLVDRLNFSYETKPRSLLISTDELALLQRLPSEVGEDEVIAGSPWTGTSLAFAFADREVVLPHMLMNEISADRIMVMDHLRDAATNPQVCEAADRLGVRYVLDFGRREVHKENHRYKGIERLDRAEGFELVDHEGSARLYRLTACG